MMKPKLLWESRPEYQEFELKKFRGHLHQELRSEPGTLYWIVERKKGEWAGEARRSGKRVDDGDVDPLSDPAIATL